MIRPIVLARADTCLLYRWVPGKRGRHRAIQRGIAIRAAELRDNRGLTLGTPEYMVGGSIRSTE